MKTSTKLLLSAIILPLLSYLLIYYIAKADICKPTCKNKICGQSDGCSGKCKTCPSGKTCDGKKCQQVSLIPSNEKNIKGICYFDIDDTLTTAKGNRDEIMKECIKNDFAIGIITASGRKVSDICNGNKASVPWMSDILCKQFNEDNAKMYNSTTIVAGEPVDKVIKEGWPVDKVMTDPGFVKGWDMEYGRKKFYNDVPDKCVVLFDDQPGYMDGVKRFNPEFEVECANMTCGANRFLDKEMVNVKIEKMKRNGCI